MRKFPLIVFFILSVFFAVPFSYAVLPDELSSNSGQTCGFYCLQAATKCDLDCGTADYGACSDEETNRECSQRWMDAAWACKVGCAGAYEGCKKSCTNYDSVPDNSKNKIDPTLFRDYEKSLPSCSPENATNGCCPGYKLTGLGFCCREGYNGVKNKEGIPACVKGVESPSLKSINIRLSKANIDYSSDKSVRATIRFEFSDPSGKPVNTEGMVYPGRILAEATDKELSGIIEFKASPLKSTLDKNGEVSADIIISKLDLLSDLPSKITVWVYDSEMPDKKAVLNVFLPKVYIKSFKKTTDGPAWQDSWSTYEIEVFDPYGLKKDYYMSAQEGIIRVEEIEQGKNAVVTTKENKIQFAWKAPKITQEIRLNYGTKVAAVMIDIAASKALDKGKNKFNNAIAAKKNSLRIASRIDEFTGLDPKKKLELINAITLLEKTIEETDRLNNFNLFLDNTKTILETTKNDDKDDPSYVIGKNVIEAASTIEGFFSSYGGKTPISLLLRATKETFELTDQMKEIARSKKITNTYFLDVNVKSKKGSESRPLPVAVEGYEMILAEENYVPFK